MAGVGRARVIGVEVDDLAAECGAVEHAAEQAQHDGEPAALVAADRQQQALRAAPGIGERAAGPAVDQPALRHVAAGQRVFLDGAVGDDGGRHVEHDGPVAGRHRDAERIGAEQQFRAAPHRHVVGIGDRGVEPDHAVLDRHRRIEPRRARMVRSAHADPADAGVARERDRGVGGAAHHQMAHAVVAVDQRGRRRGLGDRDVRLGVEPAGADAADILRQAKDAVGVGAGEIGFGHQLRDFGGIGRRQPDGGERVSDEGRRWRPARTGGPRPARARCGHPSVSLFAERKDHRSSSYAQARCSIR